MPFFYGVYTIQGAEMRVKINWNATVWVALDSSIGSAWDSSLFIIVNNLIMFSLWCIDWVGSLYANRMFMYFCIKSSIETQGEVS